MQNFTPLDISSVSQPPKHNKKSLTSRTKIAFGSVLVLAVGIVSGFFLISNNVIFQNRAWSTNQSAVAKCADNGTAIIEASFTNTEPDQPDQAMNVKARDLQSGVVTDMGTILPGGKSKTVTIATTKKTLNAGTVQFELAWTDVTRSGEDSRTATYSAVGPCSSPTPSPTKSFSPTPTVGKSSSCPAGTDPLFTKSGSISNGYSVAKGGMVTAIDGSWQSENRDNTFYAADGHTMTITFPSEVIMDTVLIYDNDPKSGESGWSINGKKLKTTDNNEYTTDTVNLTSKTLNFDYGGDSPHFNVCLKSPVLTPTFTPTPSPTLCPKPGKVTNVKITCPTCEGL